MCLCYLNEMQGVSQCEVGNKSLKLLQREKPWELTN
jgi:hypothetical protein